MQNVMSSKGKTALDFTVQLNDGSVIPSLGLGTAAPESDYERLVDAVKEAIRSGVRHIDTAWYYGTEPYIGKALKELLANGEIKRDELFITTKVWPALWDRAEVSVDKSLKDLGVDYVDLVLQHWPVAFEGTDANGFPKNPRDDKGALKIKKDADFLETYKQLIKIRDSTNKIRSVGVSNYTEKFLQRAIDETGVTPVLNQIELHPRLPQKRLVEFAESKGIKIAAYSPLGSSGAPLLEEPLVKELAKKYGVGEANVLYSYHIVSGRIVLPRSSNAERVKTFKELALLSTEDLGRLDDLGEKKPKRFINDDWGIGLGFDHWKTKASWE